VHDTGREIEHLAHRDHAAARNGLGLLENRRDALLGALGELRDEVFSRAG
jgi:hypothetical protein